PETHDVAFVHPVTSAVLAALTIAVPATNCARGDTGATRVDERNPQSLGTRDRPEADQGSTGVFAGATRRREAPTLSCGRRRIRERPATNINSKVAVDGRRERHRTGA